MQKTSIVILSYNTYEYTRLCIESIRKYTKKGTYELIVVDNASTDQSIVWLKKQKDIRCVFNKANEGFPKGCNQGMQIARGSEILLLNSDTVVTIHWLDILLKALYSNPKIGAVSCVTNSCSNRQQIEVSYQSLDEMQQFAKTFNNTDPNKWERSLTLVGFCFLLKKNIYQEIGGLDEQFSPGNFEDDDYSLRIWQKGYELLLCRDIFIHHFGSASFLPNLSTEEKARRSLSYKKILDRNFRIFKEKWGLDEYYKEIHGIIYALPEKLKTGARVLLLNTGSSLDLFILKKKYPNVEFVNAMMQKGDAAVISYAFPSIYIENMEDDLFQKIEGKFDFIICVDDLKEFIALEGFLEKINGLLYAGGQMFFAYDGRVSVKKNTRPCSRECTELDVFFTSFLQKEFVDSTVLENYDVESLLFYIINQLPFCQQVKALNQLAVWFSENGRRDDVIPCLNKALELAPGDILSTKNLGIFLFSLKEYDLAKKYFFKIKEDPEVKQILDQIAIALEEEESTLGNAFEQVLFLGNSITLHGFASYWWGEWGMAASCLERDYVHRVMALMQDEGFMVHENVFNFFVWETMWHDRGQALQLLQNYVHSDLTLVVVQLAENISELGELEQDYCDLIDYIHRAAPQARIIMIGSFWPKIDVEIAKRRACKFKRIGSVK